MLLRPQFVHYCEVVGRASAFVALVTMASIILAATAVDVLRANRLEPSASILRSALQGESTNIAD